MSFPPAPHGDCTPAAPTCDYETIISRSPLPMIGLDGPAKTSAGPKPRTWLYPRAQFGRGALQALFSESRRTMCHVSYPETATPPALRALFRLRGHGTAVLVDATGVVSVEASSSSSEATASTTAETSFTPPPRVRHLKPGTTLCFHGEEAITLVVDAKDGQPPAICLAAPASRGQEESSTVLGERRNSLRDIHVETLLEGDKHWYPADIFFGGQAPPHATGEPVTEVELAHEDGGSLWVAPLPLLGHVVIDCPPGAEQPVLTAGESPAEALAGTEFAECHTDLKQVEPGRWVSRNRLGLRYVLVDGATASRVHVRASSRTFSRRGAFACSDERLTRMWTVAATTLGTCMQTLVVDGIKRDRLPWMADNAAAIGPNAYAFGDSRITANGIAALFLPQSGYVNGIADYTLWGVIALALDLEAFDDEALLAATAPELDEVVTSLLAMTNSNGLLYTTKDESSFPHTGPGAVFLDWGVEVAPQRTPTAFQALWYWALRSAVRVGAHLRSAEAPDAPSAGQLHSWEECATRVARTLNNAAWDHSTGAWREYVDGVSRPTPLANTLATLAGLTPLHAPGVETQILATSSGTPSMRAWALRALVQRGLRHQTVDELVRIWGPLVDAGVNTFWEEFPSEGEQPTQMYGRPFGKSLCHGWAAGPADLLVLAILGVQALAPGWEEFTVDPQLGELEWAACAIPTVHGDVCVVAERGRTTVDVPAGTALVRGAERFVGPARAIW
ncbi:hypothetical protein DRB06_00060 [Actinomyces sp. Z5]|nr:hypothetical protein DRB06_00060 [Actinomyces sp. Z5]